MTTRFLLGLIVSILPVCLFAQDSSTEASAVDVVNEARIAPYQLSPGVRKGVLVAVERMFVLDTPEGILVRPPRADGTPDVQDSNPRTVTPVFQFTVHLDGRPDTDTVTFLQANTPEVAIGTRILLNTPEEGTPIFMVQERPRITEFTDNAPESTVVYTTEAPIIYERPLQTTRIVDPFYSYNDYWYRQPYNDYWYRQRYYRGHFSSPEHHTERPVIITRPHVSPPPRHVGRPNHLTPPHSTPPRNRNNAPHSAPPAPRSHPSQPRPPEIHNNHSNPPQNGNRSNGGTPAPRTGSRIKGSKIARAGVTSPRPACGGTFCNNTPPTIGQR